MRMMLPIGMLLGMMGLITPSSRADETTPLTEMNARFRAIYARAGSLTLKPDSPVILLEGDDLVLLHHGERKVERAIPKGYHDRKAISHLPLGLVVLLNEVGPMGLTDADRTDLTEIRARAEAAQRYLPKLGWTGDLLARQEKIFAASIAFIDRALQKGAPPAAEIQQFARDMAPLVMSNAAESTALQIDGMHSIVRKWQKAMPPEEWKKLTVVIVGAQMPRKGNLATQYFAKLLNEPGEGRRIIYAESLWEEPKALRLLATHRVDRKVAVAFFNDDERMHRDLLDDAAKDYLAHFDWNK
ncbi:hypothetical protein [Tuwongella immobilis]|uniref:Uncharacterized protein n=1 Tax=Tuwongella immobilis TaxID=692036 RepID=A0A6C2YRU9_9BACT|nr:hypothetical protein [Tuwongella immobilis]VIP03705.1 Uncharacterized protein OS=Solibacter usitatus (strain Ellin6076) GN=Acid_4170 PE=4 SV=1 [Tuwongella immobilis]VTS04778.1 Uncharacterized protein OS=Solibacter usitatus (strain Ellin6076) GN=Acid_4170 PE=4 SV=1 [Tuwongella immobilis]